MDAYVSASLGICVIDPIKKFKDATPAQKKTRPFAAKEIISQTASNAPDLYDDPVIPHSMVMLPNNPKMTTEITPDPPATALVT